MTHQAALDPTYDLVVVGAGVVGSAIAREFAGYDLRVALLDSRADVGAGTSKANTAILHTGFDAKPGTLESRLVARGYHLVREYGEQVGLGIDRTGAVLVAWTPEELDALPGLAQKAASNGYEKTEIVSADDVYAMVPDLGPGALGGLAVPDESIIDAWTTTTALATDAVNRGVTLLREHGVAGVTVGPEVTTLATDRGAVTTRWVVNAAGLGGDALDREFGYDRFHLHPRRGELLVFDKLTRPKAGRIVLPVPTALGKGVLVSPTIYGNVMVGPTAEDMTDRTDTATTEAGFEFLFSKGERLMPSLMAEEVTATYAGLRAASDLSDYLLEADADRRYLVAGGIRSTGLTSCMAVAEHLRELAAKAGLTLEARDDLPEPPRMPPLAESALRPYQDDARIAGDPEYGNVVCFCERVTAGEIRDAFASPIPPLDMEGLRRRTRAGNGRCQGFYCGAELQRRFDEGAAADKRAATTGHSQDRPAEGAARKDQS